MGDETTALQTLEERTTLRFPRELPLAAIETMLAALSTQLPGKITYHYGVIRCVEPRDAGTTTFESLSGTITRYSDNYQSVGFELRRSGIGSDTNLEAFDGLRFTTPPGYDLDEIDRHELALMDSVRAHLDHYFRSG